MTVGSKKRAQAAVRPQRAGGDLAAARKPNGPEMAFPGVQKRMPVDLAPVRLPAVFARLFEPHRYKVAYGGRGGAKSWAFADALLTIAMQRPVRVLCARELQRSIRDSVHRLLADRIRARGLDNFFEVTDSAIRCATGSAFGFAGLRHNAAELKSYEGVDICWVEEGQKVSRESWDILIPTIRREGSEIWISLNPDGPNDPTYTDFVLNPPPDTLLIKAL